MTRQAAAVATRRRAPAAVVVWRFVTGQHLHGRRLTDATFFGRGTQALAPRWFGRAEASAWAMMPGWQRAGIRLAAVAVAFGLWRWRHVTEWTLTLAGGPALGLLGWSLVWRVMMRRHRARVVVPLAAALAGPLESTPAEVTRTLYVPRHIGPAARVTAALPDHHQGAPGQVEAVTRIIGQRLGGEWQATVSRSPLALIVTPRPEPPEQVTFGQVADLIRAQGSATRVLMGLGAGGDPVWLDFGSEIAHLGLSVGTGGGKSAFLRYVIAQFAHHGVADFPVIDSKMVSLSGMDDVPGLRVYREPAEQWEALAELRADMDARYRTLLADPSATFPLTVVLLEEQNDAAIEWAAYWAEVRGPRDRATPPVYADVTRLAVKGRQVGYRIIGVYQRMTARACGGIDATVMRDAYGMKALARFGPGAWDSLTGIRPRAASSAIPGRFVQVIGHDVRAVQVPYAEAAELVAFARSGAAPAEAWTPPAAPAPVVGRPRLVTVGADGTADVGSPAPSPASETPGVVVGLAAAAELLGMNPETFRKARQRRPIPGELPADYLGRPRWPAEALTAWRAARPSAAASEVA